MHDLIRCPWRNVRRVWHIRIVPIDDEDVDGVRRRGADLRWCWSKSKPLGAVIWRIIAVQNTCVSCLLDQILFHGEAERDLGTYATPSIHSCVTLPSWVQEFLLSCPVDVGCAFVCSRESAKSGEFSTSEAVGPAGPGWVLVSGWCLHWRRPCCLHFRDMRIKMIIRDAKSCGLVPDQEICE